eukprot:631078-Amphidinium_carterae.1
MSVSCAKNSEMLSSQRSALPCLDGSLFDPEAKVDLVEELKLISIPGVDSDKDPVKDAGSSPLIPAQEFMRAMSTHTCAETSCEGVPLKALRAVAWTAKD